MFFLRPSSRSFWKLLRGVLSGWDSSNSGGDRDVFRASGAPARAETAERAQRPQHGQDVEELLQRRHAAGIHRHGDAHMKPTHTHKGSVLEKSCG